MIPIAKPLPGEEEIHVVAAVLRSGEIAEGERIAEFETKFADYICVEYAVAVNSGKSALNAALLAHGIGAGNEVITTSFSFIAIANSILFTDAKPVFVDIEYDTFNIDTDDIIDKITQKTKALMPVLEEESGLTAGEDFALAHAPERVMVDGRNVVEPDEFIGVGFVYKGIGRGDKNRHFIII